MRNKRQLISLLDISFFRLSKREKLVNIKLSVESDVAFYRIEFGRI